MIEVTCKCCPDKFEAREADRKRGWAQFCSKSCAAYYKTYGKRRKHQSKEAREIAKAKNQLRRSQQEQNLEDQEYFGEIDIPDVEFGASDGGGWVKFNELE